MVGSSRNECIISVDTSKNSTSEWTFHGPPVFTILVPGQLLLGALLWLSSLLEPSRLASSTGVRYATHLSFPACCSVAPGNSREDFNDHLSSLLTHFPHTSSFTRSFLPSPPSRRCLNPQLEILSLVAISDTPTRSAYYIHSLTSTPYPPR